MFWTVCEGPMKNVRCVSPFQPNVSYPVVPSLSLLFSSLPPPCTSCTSTSATSCLFISLKVPQVLALNATSNQTSSRMLTCIFWSNSINKKNNPGGTTWSRQNSTTLTWQGWSLERLQISRKCIFNCPAVRTSMYIDVYRCTLYESLLSPSSLPLSFCPPLLIGWT